MADLLLEGADSVFAEQDALDKVFRERNVAERYYAGAVLVSEKPGHTGLFTVHCFANSHDEAKTWVCKGMKKQYPKAQIIPYISRFNPYIADDVSKKASLLHLFPQPASQAEESQQTWFERKLKQAVADEREQCAKIADVMGAPNVAAMIRQTSGEPKIN